MTIVTVKRINALFSILDDHIRRRVKSDGNFEDWNVMAPAQLSIVRDLASGVLSATPPDGRFRAEVLSRSLTEHAIAFAWVAAGDGDERSRRIRSVIRNEFDRRSSVGNQLTNEIASRNVYQDLFEGNRLPEQLLDEGTRESHQRLKDDDVKPAPGVINMAFEADERWMSEHWLLERNPFALIYFTLFNGPNFSTHASITAISKVVTGNPPNLLVGRITRETGSEMPYSQSLLTFANTLLVASMALGWFDTDAVAQALGADE